MNDNQYETVAVLAGLIRRAKLCYVPREGYILAVPITEIAEVLEKFSTTQTAQVSDDISLCPSCDCMTHGEVVCGKCGKVKV